MKKGLDGNVSTKLLRDLSFKPRFRQSYGSNDYYYNFILKYKEAWESKLFYVDESTVSNMLETYPKLQKVIPEVRDVDEKLPDTKISPLLSEDEVTGFGVKDLSLRIFLEHGDRREPIDIGFGHAIDLKNHVNRKGLILNAGGHITSMKWLISRHSQKYQYLAVSVISNKGGILNNINNTQLSLFHKGVEKDALKSGIQIWKYDLEGNALVLDQFYLTDTIGATSNLEWVPIEIGGDTDTIGVLGGSFTDGQFHLVKIKKTQHNTTFYGRIKEPSLTYKIQGFSSKNSTDLVAITCYDYLNKDRFIVGLTNGSIAEFPLPFAEDLNDSDSSEEDYEKPSFIQKVADTAIVSVSISELEASRYTLIINTSGIQCFALEYNNFRQGYLISAPTNSFLKPSKNHLLNATLGSYSSDTVSLSFLRNPQDTLSVVLKVDGIVSSVLLSEILGHPLGLVGSTQGDIYILNYARKFLNGAKTTNKSLVPLKLWKCSMDNNDIVVSSNLVPVTVDKSNQINIAPPQILISAIAWNENIAGSSIYTAGSISGLLLLERLDPKV
ncbi:uncharacterized protein PRCAT00000708001 [Priceomyces carsonii]|uniref:uncharacterized protein n=1 Tax=Priceomyces carsonii TaxID=28549 RepID=UPI002ED88E3A|nr:unnamed protein product [Priceomyces carsonii]